MSDKRTTGIDETGKTGETPPFDPNQYTLEQLVLLVTTERLHQIEKKSRDEIKELSERQKKVEELHKILSKMNALTDNSGHLKMDEELHKLLEAAKSEGLDLNIKEVGGEYDTRERDRLVDNVRMRVDDLNIKNDMQIQAITRLTNERYESYQLARSILKPLDEDKKNKARAIRGN